MSLFNFCMLCQSDQFWKWCQGHYVGMFSSVVQDSFQWISRKTSGAVIGQFRFRNLNWPTILLLESELETFAIKSCVQQSRAFNWNWNRNWSCWNLPITDQEISGGYFYIYIWVCLKYLRFRSESVSSYADRRVGLTPRTCSIRVYLQVSWLISQRLGVYPNPYISGLEYSKYKAKSSDIKWNVGNLPSHRIQPVKCQTNQLWVFSLLAIL